MRSVSKAGEGRLKAETKRKTMNIEPGTGLAILGAAAGSAKLVEKMLGLTAEYIGEGLKNWTAKAASNVGKIITKAAFKAG